MLARHLGRGAATASAVDAGLGRVLAGSRVSGRIRHGVRSDGGGRVRVAAAVQVDGWGDGGGVLSQVSSEILVLNLGLV